MNRPDRTDDLDLVLVGPGGVWLPFMRNSHNSTYILVLSRQILHETRQIDNHAAVRRDLLARGLARPRARKERIADAPALPLVRQFAEQQRRLRADQLACHRPADRIVAPLALAQQDLLAL